jgi:hypothetical protein
MLVVGGTEAASNSAAVRAHGRGDLGAVPLPELIASMQERRAARA